MEMQQIRYFLALARTLNFTRAADECNVTQPALTRAIQALEAEFGGPLIRRERQQSHLTELGRRMLPLMERCFDSALAAKAVAKSISKDNITPLSVAISDSVNVEKLSGPFAEMFRGFSGLQLKIQHGGGAEIVEILKQGKAEIAIAGPIDSAWDRLDHWTLFDEPFELAVRDDHPLARDNNVTLEKLRDIPLFCQSGCEMHDAAVRIFESGGIPLNNMHEVTTYSDLDVLLSSGLGAAIIPHSAPRTDGTSRPKIADLNLMRTVSAYAVAGRHRETATAAFLNLLRNTDFESA